VRSATPKAVAFCEAWSSKFTSNEQKLAALAAATLEHSALVKECIAGKGVERHLFALKCIAERHNIPLPDFFKSKAWDTLNHTFLSTSNCGNPSLRHFGFGAVVPDGFGIGYIIKDQTMHFSISSRRQTDRYANTLRRFLCQVESMLTPKLKVQVVSSSVRRSWVGQKLDKVYYADGYDEYHDTETFPPPRPKPKPEVRRSSFMIASVKVRPHVAEELLEKVGLTLSRANSVDDSNDGG
jgi:carnitine O-acetyltransferase